MSKKAKHEEFRFTFQHFVRLSIFLFLVYFLILIFSSKTSRPAPRVLDPTVLGEEDVLQNNNIPNLYDKLPENSRRQLEQLGQMPAIIFLQEKTSSIGDITKDFPEKQIKEIKKTIIKNIYDDLIKSIDESP